MHKKSYRQGYAHCIKDYCIYGKNCCEIQISYFKEYENLENWEPEDTVFKDGYEKAYQDILERVIILD